MALSAGAGSAVSHVLPCGMCAGLRLLLVATLHSERLLRGI